MELLIIIRSPAPFFAARALFDRHAGLKPFAGSVATLQLARAKTYGLCLRAPNALDDRLLVLLGFWPNADGSEELFVVGRPAEELQPFMHKLARATRLILSWRLHSGTRSIVVLVRRDNEAGHRLARLGGFTASQIEPAPGGFVRYELRMNACRRKTSPKSATKPIAPIVKPSETIRSPHGMTLQNGSKTAPSLE